MKSYTTKNFTWTIDAREVRIDGADSLHIDKREFAEALVGLGIVHSAVVRHADDQVPEMAS